VSVERSNLTLNKPIKRRDLGYTFTMDVRPFEMIGR